MISPFIFAMLLNLLEKKNILAFLGYIYAFEVKNEAMYNIHK